MNLAERIAARQMAAMELEKQKALAEQKRREAEYEQKVAELGAIPFESIVEAVESYFQRYPNNATAIIGANTWTERLVVPEYVRAADIPLEWATATAELFQSYGFKVQINVRRPYSWIIHITLP